MIGIGIPSKSNNNDRILESSLWTLISIWFAGGLFVSGRIDDHSVPVPAAINGEQACEERAA